MPKYYLQDPPRKTRFRVVLLALQLSGGALKKVALQLALGTLRKVARTHNEPDGSQQTCPYCPCSQGQAFLLFAFLKGWEVLFYERTTVKPVNEIS